MKSSLCIVGCFVAGCLLGYSGLLPDSIVGSADSYSKDVLCVLMLFVGLNIGSDRHLREILRSISGRILFVLSATYVGTFVGTIAVSFFISRWTTTQCLAVGSGLGYYSLSSVLITQLMEPSIGSQAASELGTVALIANLIRELSVLLFAPLMVRYFGKLAPICAGGATTMDTTLPVITQYAGKEVVFISIIHAIIADLSVPILVSLFCSM